MAQSLDIYLSPDICEAVDAQGIALDADAEALHDMAAQLGTRLSATPDLLLIVYANRWRDSTPPDINGYTAPVTVTWPEPCSQT